MESERPPWGGMQVLPDDTHVHRVLKYRSCVGNKDGKVKRKVFLLKPSEDGLSVTNPLICTPQQVCETFEECLGTVTLQVGRIRSIGLDVIPDTRPSPEYPCDHALIEGLPPYIDPNIEAAESLAIALAEICEELTII
jgi:hypothetical protein